VPYKEEQYAKIVKIVKENRSQHVEVDYRMLSHLGLKRVVDWNKPNLGRVQADICRLLAMLEDNIMTFYRAERDLDRKSKKLMMNFKKLFAIEFMKIVQRKRAEDAAKST